MATSQTGQLIHHLRQLLAQDAAALTDAQLLGCFLNGRDETAFAALVKRHGPLVWNVCRRLLSEHDAEDAFQATFLVLCRKASSIRRRERVASWLYGVAHQTALQARRAAARRKAREKQVVDVPEPAAGEQELCNDLQPLLDRELSRLPQNYQVVILLCDLEGKTRKEAAGQLGLPEGTVGSRLARARAMLARRLARRGLAATGATMAAVLSEKAVSAPVPPSLLSSTIQAAGLLAAGQAAASAGIPAPVAALMESVMKAMLLTKLRIAITVVAALAIPVLAGLGVGHRFLQTRASESPSPAARERDQPRPHSAEKPRTVPKETERRIRSVVPKGWTVTAAGDTLTVRRDKPVLVVNQINAPPGPADPEARKADLKKRSLEQDYTIVLRFQPRISRQHWQRLDEENDRTSEKADQLRQKVRQVPHKFDSYLPKNAEQERLVREYREAVKKLTYHDLPNFYDDHSSIKLTTSLLWGFDFVDEEVRKECLTTRTRIEELFHPYEKAAKTPAPPAGAQPQSSPQQGQDQGDGSQQPDPP